MPHIHWVARQNKLEIPRDKDEVNKREIHECDGRANDPDTMVAPLTPEPTRKAEALARAPPTIASCREEDAALRKWPLSRYCCASCILETKTKVGTTGTKVPVPRINPNINETPTPPKSHTHPSHEYDGYGEGADSETYVVYYESIKRDLKIRGIYECRCDERLKPKDDESTSDMTRIHWVARGTGIPKDRDEVNRRDVCECDG